MRSRDRLVLRVVELLRPALDTAFHDYEAASSDVVSSATRRIDQVRNLKSGPAVAVYIAWDQRGVCRYVGSTRRPGSRSAVTARLREHLRHDNRFASWAYVSILPLRGGLTIEQVRECEGLAARRLMPLDGAAHPIPRAGHSLSAWLRA